MEVNPDGADKFRFLKKVLSYNHKVLQHHHSDADGSSMKLVLNDELDVPSEKDIKEYSKELHYESLRPRGLLQFKNEYPYDGMK